MAVALLGGCRTAPAPAPAIGEAFVGPATLKIRSDIPLQSSAVTTVKHGDRLELLQRRRRFLRVRTPSGLEGWADERQLLARADMDKLRELTSQARALPAQGQATSFSDLNVHTQPWRQSPSFLQVKEGEKVDVLLHRAVPRTDMARPPLIPPAPKKAKKAAEKKPKEPPKYPPPPMPKPPQPPENWLELSRTDADEAEPADEDKETPAEKAAPPAPIDDWSLVRLANGSAGWVLTRRLVMAIPDEVAQYAEGRRIVSYFPLGEVKDGEEKKHQWLWTTINSGNYPYDFDSFRVFVWSLRRHRYETSYIERNIRGYAPVTLREVVFSPTARARVGESGAKYPGFSVCVEKGGGPRIRRDYAFIGNVVRLAGERACESPPEITQQIPSAAALGEKSQSAPGSEETFGQRFQRRLKALAGRWFGR